MVYLPRSVPEADLAIMRRLDRLHLELPFAGSRMLRGLLAAEGCKIGRRHVKTLMRRMGIEALYRRPRTTKPEPGHKIYPYLLRGVGVTRPNQVWAMDITYIPMARGSLSGRRKNIVAGSAAFLWRVRRGRGKKERGFLPWDWGKRSDGPSWFFRYPASPPRC